MDDTVVAEYLLRKQFYATALELHQELLEGNNGVHNVSSLNKFFTDESNLKTLIAETEKAEQENKKNAIGLGPATVVSPFTREGLQPALAARDQQISLLEFKLRIAQNENQGLKQKLTEIVNTGVVPAGAQSQNTPSDAKQSTNAPSGGRRGPLSEDEDGVAINDRERRTLNAMIRRYLYARGYKMAALSLAGEANEGPMSSSEEGDLLMIPSSIRGTSTTSVLSLLGMYRNRVAPLQELKESHGRFDNERAGLKNELRKVQDKLTSSQSNVSRLEARVRVLESELEAAKRAASTAASVHAQLASPLSPAPATQQGEEVSAAVDSNLSGSGAAAMPVTSTEAPPQTPQKAPTAQQAQLALMSPFQAAAASAAATMPQFLLEDVLISALPHLLPALHSRARTLLAPLLAAATLTSMGAGQDRAATLLHALLGLQRRPNDADVAAILACVKHMLALCPLPAFSESLLLPQVLLLARTGAVPQRVRLAAQLGGLLAPEAVLRGRVDVFCALLTEAAQNRAASARLGATDGLAALCKAISSHLTANPFAGGTRGGGANNAFVRAFQVAEETFWGIVLASADSAAADARAHSASAAAAAASDDHESEQLELSEAAEKALDSESYLAGAADFLAVLGPGAGACAAARESMRRELFSYDPKVRGWRGGRSARANVAGGSSLSQSSLQSVAEHAFCVLLPALVQLALQLDMLFSSFLPRAFSLLTAILASKVPEAVTFSHAVQEFPMKDLSAVVAYCSQIRGSNLVLAHEARSKFVSAALSSLGPILRDVVLEEGYSLEYIGPTDAPKAAPATPGTDASKGAAANADASKTALNPHTDYLYELFPFTSTASLQTTHPMLPLECAVRGGKQVFPPTVDATPLQAAHPLAAHSSRALLALLSGSAAVRRRRNTPIPAQVLTQTPPPLIWQPIRDEFLSLNWPSAKAVFRSVLPAFLALAGSVGRGSAAGRAVSDALAVVVQGLAGSFGREALAAFSVMVTRGLGIPNLFDHSTSSSSSNSSNTAAGSTPSGGRQSSSVLWAKLLFGTPSSPAEAVRAAKDAQRGLLTASGLNYASAGPKGSDWALVMPELQFLFRNGKFPPPIHPESHNAAPEDHAAAHALLLQQAGGPWNSSLLPVFGSAVLCSPLLPADVLQRTVRALVEKAASDPAWIAVSSALEDCIVRACGVANVGALPKHPQLSSPSSLSSSTSQPTPPALPTHGPGSLVWSVTLTVAAMSSHADARTRAVAGAILRALTPFLPAALCEDGAFQAALRALTADSDPAVVKSGVRLLAALFTYSNSSAPTTTTTSAGGAASGAGGQGGVLRTVASLLAQLLARGPKDTIVELLRAMLRAIPSAAPSTRDSFILDCLLELAGRIRGAAAAARDAANDMRMSLGHQSSDDMHHAVASALEATREAAFAAAAPWEGASPADLEETTMAILECLRALCAASPPLDPKSLELVRETATALLEDRDLTEEGYAQMMLPVFQIGQGRSGPRLHDNVLHVEASSFLDSAKSSATATSIPATTTATAVDTHRPSASSATYGGYTETNFAPSAYIRDPNASIAPLSFSELSLDSSVQQDKDKRKLAAIGKDKLKGLSGAASGLAKAGMGLMDRALGHDGSSAPSSLDSSFSNANLNTSSTSHAASSSTVRRGSVSNSTAPQPMSMAQFASAPAPAQAPAPAAATASKTSQSQPQTLSMAAFSSPPAPAAAPAPTGTKAPPLPPRGATAANPNPAGGSAPGGHSTVAAALATGSHAPAPAPSGSSLGMQSPISAAAGKRWMKGMGEKLKHMAELE